MANEHFTPKVVADLFKALSPEQQKECLELMDFTAEGLFLLLGRLSKPDLARFNEMLFNDITSRVFPWLVRHAIDEVKARPEASKEELCALVNEATKRSIEEYNASIGELAKAQLKEQRDRKSDPETIRRNVEICNLRRQDPKKWSLGMLGKRFELSRQAIKRIFEEEGKWRRLAAQL